MGLLISKADKFLYRSLVLVNAYKCAKFQFRSSISFRAIEGIPKFNVGLKLLCVLKVLCKIKQPAKFQYRISMHHAIMQICVFHRLSIICIKNQQELSYRKQIARQLRTQFVEGISVTLKSTLRVIQGHWKRSHWTDHTRHLLLDELLDFEYYRDLEMWVRGHSRLLKVVPFESLGTVS